MRILNFTLAFTVLLFVSKGYGQNQSALSENLTDKINKLFEPWANSEGPGVSFAIIKDGQVIYKKNCGSADINNKIPITSQTRFNLAHSSAHFTAYALLKLVVEGKLSLKDDASNFVKELRSLDQTITIKNLLYGSSGIYNYQVLKSICGWDYTDKINQKDVLKLVSLQNKSIFEPGTDYSEADINFVILAEVIASATGKTYKAYMEENIFAPLGMTHTFVKANPNTIYHNLANSYRTEEDTIVINNSENSILGINNIYSSIDDLILWENHLNEGLGKNKEVIELMDNIIKLENGRANSTSSGELTLGQLYGHKERGLFSTYILGSASGHDSSIFKFPNQNYTAIALSNNGDGYNGYLGVLSAHNILGSAFTEPETTDFDKVKTKSIPKKLLQTFEGHYWDRLGELSREIKVVNDTLRYIRANGNATPLIPLTDNKFQMKVQFDDKIYIHFPREKTDVMIYQYDGAEPIAFEKYNKTTLDKKELSNLFNGIYINKDYNIAFGVEVANSKLILSNAKNGTMNFTPVKPELFLGDKWYMRSIEFTKDNSQNINGFYIKNNAIRNLWFEKIALN